jgi:hypothetical protein
MLYRKRQVLRSVMKILGSILIIVTSAGAEEKRDMGGWELKVRLTKSGRPFWTMTPDELNREREP